MGTVNKLLYARRRMESRRSSVAPLYKELAGGPKLSCKWAVFTAAKSHSGSNPEPTWGRQFWSNQLYSTLWEIMAS